MREKVAGYALLSFFSFVFFTFVFHTVANAETAVIPVSGLVDAQTSDALIPSPTPTIFFYSPSINPTEISQSPTISGSTSVTTTSQARGSTTTAIPSASPALLIPNDNIPSPTETPKPTAAPIVTPTVIPTATPTPQPVLASTVGSTDLEVLFTTYSDTYHVNKSLLEKIASCESSDNPNATNGDYTGMFQFATSSWISVRSTMGLDTNPDLRRNAEESIRTAAYMISQGRASAWPTCSK